MPIRVISTSPIQGQRPGTSGLRKKTREFIEPRYLENFVQSVFDAVRETEPELASHTLVVGGDGRYHNRAAIQKIVALAAGNGFGEVLVARGGILSTPAMSAVIRRRKAFGGLVLSASHNPGGIDGDFGIKYNVRNGGPAPEPVTERIYRHTLAIAEYRWWDHPEVDLEHDGLTQIGRTRVTVFDPMADYVRLMAELFDFDALAGLFARGFRLVFDAMNGVTGPYARALFVDRLGAPEDTVLGGHPLEDFGGRHPDPNLVHAAELVERMRGAGAPDLGAACDGDGDRNMILGPNFYVSPCDSVAVIAEHAARSIPGYSRGLRGIARSMPTSTAVDRVARSLGIPCHETPTGWKFFGNLMDAGLCTICGEESFGTGSDHVREKDGLWAVLCWLSILQSTRRSLEALVREHWARFGRSYYQRHDYEGLDAGAAAAMYDDLRARLPRLTGVPFAGSAVETADEFSYTDPVDGARSERQGIRLLLDDGSRVVFRLSGTGTEGATLRIYLERYRLEGEREIQSVLAPLAGAARDVIELHRRTGIEQPTVIT